LDNVVTQTIAYEGDGRWKEYAGGYGDWQRARPAPEGKPKAQPRQTSSSSPPPAPAPEPKRAKLGYREARELEALPARIETLEREQSALAARLADPATYRDAAADVAALNRRHAEIEAELARLLERCQVLEVVVYSKSANLIEIVLGEGLHSVKCALTPTRLGLSYAGNVKGRELVYERSRDQVQAELDLLNPRMRDPRGRR